MNLTRFKSLVVLSGAGISSESGIRTFRDSNGLWENHRIEDVASPEGFKRNPRLVQEFYNQRRRQLLEPEVAPNKAHAALAKLEAEWEGPFLLVTQNIDDLHERAGSRHPIHMHGELRKIFCQFCESRFGWNVDLVESSVCQECKKQGTLRPDIVWFGEMPYQMEKIEDALTICELFIAVGTSGHVYPAAGFARLAYRAHRIEVNVQPSLVSTDFHEHRIGLAATQVPILVEQLLGASPGSST